MNKKQVTKIWEAQIITGAPDYFVSALNAGVAGRARGKVWDYATHNLHDYGTGAHKKIDDTPYGGGAGMVLRADVAAAALDDVAHAHPNLPMILPSARGTPFTQTKAEELAAGAGAIFLCSRFEGVDARLAQARNVQEISIGDYVVSGGEAATLIILEATIRLLKGVMGDATSATQESFQDGLLEYPHYTRPATWEGLPVPQILTGGDHAKIEAWRKRQAETATAARRPDLWEVYEGKKNK